MPNDLKESMSLTLSNPRLSQIEAIAAGSPLSDVAMWRDWALHVRRHLQNFAGEGYYLMQEQPQADYDRVAQYIVDHHCPRDMSLATWDCRHGAIAVDTRALGPATRAFLDGVVEADYLNRHLPGGLGRQRIIDIGAGYGRLAGIMTRLYPNLIYQCIDAVPISTFLCEFYLKELGSPARVLTLDQPFQADIAINVHSWNECSLSQITRWIELLKDTPYLFTVSHNATYSTFPYGGASFRPLLESHYDLIAPEESNALHTDPPHALWARRGISSK
jgi:SAM-dependent methyltransferase